MEKQKFVPDDVVNEGPLSGVSLYDAFLRQQASYEVSNGTHGRIQDYQHARRMVFAEMLGFLERNNLQEERLPLALQANIIDSLDSVITIDTRRGIDLAIITTNDGTIAWVQQKILRHIEARRSAK